MKPNPMNYKVLDSYMERHSFLQVDKQKIKNFIDTENSVRVGMNKFVTGYLTRTNLHLVTGFGTPEEYSRVFLGISDNFR